MNQGESGNLDLRAACFSSRNRYKERTVKPQDPLRKIVVLILERLQQLEKARYADLNMLIAAVKTLRGSSPEFDQRFRAELQTVEAKRAEDRDLDLEDVYSRLVAMLKDPDQSEEEQQDEFRRILEAFEGPKQ